MYHSVGYTLLCASPLSVDRMAADKCCERVVMSEEFATRGMLMLVALSFWMSLLHVRLWCMWEKRKQVRM